MVSCRFPNPCNNGSDQVKTHSEQLAATDCSSRSTSTDDEESEFLDSTLEAWNSESGIQFSFEDGSVFNEVSMGPTKREDTLFLDDFRIQPLQQGAVLIDLNYLLFQSQDRHFGQSEEDQDPDYDEVSSFADSIEVAKLRGRCHLVDKNDISTAT